MPPLTTLDADPRARGRQVAELILQRAAAPSMPRRSVIVPVLLTERDSTPHA
jgi:LacI family transcriptional regulator